MSAVTSILPPHRPRLRRTLALCLSLAAPGAGHLFLGHGRAALAAQAVWIGLLGLGPALTWATRTGFLLTCGIAAAWMAGVAWHAWSLAGRHQGPPRWGLAILALGVLNPLVEPSLVARLSPWTRYRALPFVSESMAPTLHPGDRVVVDFDWYGGHQVRRGDLVVFEAQGGARGLWVMRCVALPGDCVEVRDGTCQVNGLGQGPGFPARGADSAPRHLGPAEVFCLGDNRGNSFDSRSWGPLHVDAIKGRALHVPSRGNLDERMDGSFS